MRRLSRALVATALLLMLCRPAHPGDDFPVTGRFPANDEEFAYWLRNALQSHRFSAAETGAALDLPPEEIKAETHRLGIDPAGHDLSRDDGRIFVLPYPGGRHPRIGFLDGAIDPQRETKISVFTPWQPTDGNRADYVVVDVPEAIWSNLGLTYLAHTHVPTLWTNAGFTLPVLEWTRHDDGTLTIERTLPNAIKFQTRIVPEQDHVAMELTLTNGLDATLSDLRVQNCVMLKAAEGFNQQDNDNKVSRAPWMAVRNPAGDRWILTAWKPNQRTWANAKCPCLHSDPQFPDCPPGETRVLHGWLSFYEGTDINAEFDRIEALDAWKNAGS
jgi:hypothetical protein